MEADIDESTSPPDVLDYGKSKPLGYRATQKLTRFFPITSLPNTDMVRFIINSNGYWDPYSSYLRVTVRLKTDTVDPSLTPAGFASLNNVSQLDNSASSLIQTLSFIQNGVELERIDRYEVLASMLNDMFYSQEQRAQRCHEGFGCGIGERRTGINPGVAGSAVSSSIGSTDALAAPNFASARVVDNFTGMLNVLSNAAPLTSSKIEGPFGTGITYKSVIETPGTFFGGAGEPVMWGIKGTPTHQATLTFCIPILSGIFGILMPASEIKYIPMQFFPGLEMNFRLNPYAFHNLTNVGGIRNFEVSGCELFVNIIHFPPAINASIASIVRERGLYLHTCSYYYGPSHMIPASSSMETYPINMSFKSLRSILWCFIPSSYRLYAYIRELRRKALNLTAAQVRVGGDLFPTFPIGNLGSSSDSGLPSTNSDFLVNLYKAFGRLHDTVNDSMVNCHTFCEGNSILPADFSADPASFAAAPVWNDLVRGYTQSDSYMTGSSTNQAFKLCAPMNINNWLINQIVPRAIYGIDLDTITSDDSVISGVNTLINKPFELLLEGRNNSAESCELNIFLYYDMVVMVDKDYTVKYLGRGG